MPFGVISMVRYTKGVIPKLLPPDTIFTFDTENSTGYFNKYGVQMEYKVDVRNNYYDKLSIYSLPYIWQFGINNTVYYGRHLEELKDFIIELNSKCRFKKIVFVHNLAHDFMFLLNILDFTPKNVFCRKAYHPIKALNRDFNIEFRCSYFLTRLSLENWGKQIGLEKLVGALDYSKVRTPETPLTLEELEYCGRDCMVIYKGMQKYLLKYATIENIPLTQTGEVRREYKRRIQKNISLMKKIQKLQPQNEEEYNILKKCFRGGDTHANYIRANKLLFNVDSWDITSSYPFTMVTEKFPMTPWEHYKSTIKSSTLDKDKYAYMLHVYITNLEEKHPCHYIPSSKTERLVAESLDNGRVITAKEVELWCTELDLDIIEKTYKYSTLEITEYYKSRKAYLPRELREFVIELFANKTTLKDVEGFEDLYMQSKQFLNSLFGMAVTDIIMDTVEFIQVDGEYVTIESNFMESMLEYKTKLRKNYLSYSWGVWVTAYARRNLWECIIPIGKDVVYYDTDSVKLLNGNKWEYIFLEYNNRAMQKGIKALEPLKLSPTQIKPDGSPTTLGLYEKELTYLEFKTLGAKRYAYKYWDKKENGILTKFTFSGVKKSAVCVLENNLNNFTPDLVFPRDKSGKMLSVKNFNQPEILWTDYLGNTYKSTVECGSTLHPLEYAVSLGEDFASLLANLLNKK